MPRMTFRLQVSPGFMPRPSLSGKFHCAYPVSSDHVSPGFMPRPSLSDGIFPSKAFFKACVAGVYAPAFVERSKYMTKPGRQLLCRRGLCPGLR